MIVVVTEPVVIMAPSAFVLVGLLSATKYDSSGSAIVSSAIVAVKFRLVGAGDDGVVYDTEICAVRRKYSLLSSRPRILMIVPKLPELISPGVHVVPHKPPPTMTVPSSQFVDEDGGVPVDVDPSFVILTPALSFCLSEPVVFSVTVTPLMTAFAGIVNPKFVSLR
ncbi:MAG: hypothetical protein R3C17_20940 [Planctomycetaceae bacterium]